jgi:predicted transcriptional regulator
MDRDKKMSCVERHGIRYAVCVLEALWIMKDQPIRVFLITDVSGIASSGAVAYALRYLRDNGLVARYQLTERGKIALALWQGKQTKIAARRKQAA